MADFQIQLTKLELNRGNGYYQRVLNSQGVQDLLTQHAQRALAVANSCGKATYATNTQAGAKRAHAIVYTPSKHAIYSNAVHNSLLKALGSL